MVRRYGEAQSGQTTIPAAARTTRQTSSSQRVSLSKINPFEINRQLVGMVLFLLEQHTNPPANIIECESDPFLQTMT